MEAHSCPLGAMPAPGCSARTHSTSAWMQLPIDFPISPSHEPCFVQSGWPCCIGALLAVDRSSPAGSTVSSPRRRSPRLAKPSPKSSRQRTVEPAGEGEHAAGESANPMKAEPTLAIWTLVVFCVLVRGPDQVCLEAACARPARARKAPGARPARDRAGPQRERGAPERAPQADGPCRGRGSQPARQGEARRPGDGANRSSSSPGRGRGGPSSAPSATSAPPATRPSPKSGRRPPIWPSRSPAGSSPRS